MPDFSAPYNALIAQNMAPPPNMLATASQALAVQNQALQNQTLQATTDDAQLANAQNHVGYIINALTPLLRKGANISPGDVAQAGADAVAETRGRISPTEIAHFIGQLPSDGPGIQTALQQHLMRLQDANSRIATLRGQPIETDTQAGTQFGARDAFTNTYTPQAQGGYVAKQPSVGMTDGPDIQTATGPQATRVTNQQAYDIATGRARVDAQGRITYGAAPASAPASGQASPVPARVPVGPAPPLNPDGSIFLPSAPSQGQAMAIGAPAGAASAADVASKNSAAQGQSLLAAADTVPQTRATIDNMKALLPQFTSGPYAARMNQAKSAANQLGQIAGVGNVFDPKSIAAQEEFHKQAETLAAQSFAALGGTGTDRQLASAHGSNPNDALSGLGNAQILPMLEGLQDAVEAKASAWQRYRQQYGDASYGAFQTDFNRNFSPRAFQFVRMSPDQRQELVKSMNSAERSQLGGALQNAEQRGWIKPNGG